MSHIHEKYDWTVEVYVVYENKVLLRLHEKYNIWVGPGGHIELNEDPNQAALREVKEEVGLTVSLHDNTLKSGRTSDGYKDLAPAPYLNIHKINEKHSHIALIYFALTENNIIIPEDQDDKWQWLTKEELENIEGLLPDVKMYCIEALKLLGK